MANTKKIDVALASKMAQVEFDYVEDKASAFLMFNDMLELFRNVSLLPQVSKLAKPIWLKILSELHLQMI